MNREHNTYQGTKTKEISFPIGGIGSGCIGLAGNGQLIDWEIFNRPNKGSVNGFSHFAVKAERNGEVLGARVLQGDAQPPYTGKYGNTMFVGYGFGPIRETLAGVPHFRDVVFEGTYPFARLSFTDPHFPGKVVLSAWNPLIPLNDHDSSLPAAFFEVTLENTEPSPIDYTVAFSVNNPLTRGTLRNTTESSDGKRFMHLRSDDVETGNPSYGDLCVATDAEDTGYQNYWFRGRWFDSLGVFWRDFTAPGKLKDRTVPPDASARSDMATLSAHIHVNPGQSKTIRFVLTWNFPNNTNYWNPLPDETASNCGCEAGTSCGCETETSCGCEAGTNCGCEAGTNGGCEADTNCGCDAGTSCGCETETSCGCDAGTNGGTPSVSDSGKHVGTWKNWYATVFKNSSATARYALNEWTRLQHETEAFHDALFSSTLPASVLDAVSANISILKSPTCLRLEDGSFYGWEGCGCVSGCCEGSCTHVWNYAQALPFLFPKLERSMRNLDYQYNMREDGGMVFRLQLPVGREKWAFRPCVDGQYGGVLKIYRDWKISGDTEWLKGHWEAVKKNITYAWAPTNLDGWDADKDGIMEGRQHHTLDMELFGPNSWLTGMYLGALKAAAEMADFLGDAAAAKEFGNLFAKGKSWADKNLFNGEYYMQKIDLADKSLVERYDKEVSLHGDSALAAYWNEEAQEIKYQIGEGCAIDQVLAQWHANLYGLGEIYHPDQVKKALGAIYKYNFKHSFRDFFNPCRLYSLNDEGGVVICDWPPDKVKPIIPAPYSEETMNGFEYQVAIHMIQEGMVEQGIEIITAIRDRFDGEKRNPWNEYECGSNYARSMASYALLNAFAGFSFDMARKEIGFAPVKTSEDFRIFWSLASGWGVFESLDTTVMLTIHRGDLALKKLYIREKGKEDIAGVNVNGVPQTFTQTGDSIVFPRELQLHQGDTLNVVYKILH